MQLGTRILMLLLLTFATVLRCGAQSTVFAYTGHLADGGVAPTGVYDFQFRLADASVAGNYVGSTVICSPVLVSNGSFVTSIDFGSAVFDGSARWLEMSVRTNGGTDFTLLSPRQEITATPYAIFAGSAASLSGTLPAGQLAGVLSVGQLPSWVLTNGSTGANLSGTFTGTVISPNLIGNGAGITNVSFNNNAYLLTNGPPGGWINNFQRTPPLMMNNFAVYGTSMTEAQFLAECSQLAAWTNCGWTTAQWDDGWEAASRDANGNLTWNTNLIPDGLPYLAGLLHAMGMKLPLYTSMSPTTCGGNPGTALNQAYGDTKTILGWGCDGWKLDRCGTSGAPPFHQQYLRYINQAIADYWRAEVDVTSGSVQARSPYFVIQFPGVENWSSSYVEPDMLSEAQMLEVLWWGSQQSGSLPSTLTSDGLWQAAHVLQKYNSIVSPGHYAGPMNLWFKAGFVGGSWGADPYVTNYVNAAIMLCCPIQLDSALAAATYQPAMMANSELWRIHQDDAVIPASIIWKGGSPTAPAEVWSRPLGGVATGNRAILLWNSNTVPASISVNYQMFNDMVGTIYKVRDPWNHANLGSFTSTFSVTVPPTNTVLLKVKAVEPIEQQ